MIVYSGRLSYPIIKRGADLMKKKSINVTIKIVIGFIVLILVLLMLLNPNRGSFNNAVLRVENQIR